MTSMRRFLLRDCLGWGLLLWLAGYVLSFLLFAFVPVAVIGWYVMPVLLLLTCLVLWMRVGIAPMSRTLVLGLSWCAIAVVLDNLFIVRLLDPSDGYYKLDVYVYYAGTLLLPPIAALLRRGRAA
jgi:hypothetical protein